jgi:site-specific DNA-methyltransferase (adenine-specific)
MIQTNYNPDVLTCLANLSNDEVFTPPNLVNDILDLLPASIWRNPNATFLDPVCKSGVFLREIAKRLDRGLETQIPDRQKRIDHIFTKQVYGIAITELTSLLSRRSVYCSKFANGKYSVSDAFTTEQGNIHHESMQHLWQGGKCSFCGASQEVYDREDALETYAYKFIHTDNPENIFKMKFDVIVGNPPYQLTDGGGNGKSAMPIYQKFIEQAQKLNPKYLTMIIPARWYAGGKGLDEFRSKMLNDKRLVELVDFENSAEVFSGVDIAGGICYFLWDRDYNGDCKITNIANGEKVISVRSLNEFEIFIRHSKSLPIIKKIHKIEAPKHFLNKVISPRRPFGLPSTYAPLSNGIPCYFTQRLGLQYADKEDIVDQFNIIDKWKLLIPFAPIAGQTDFSKPVGFYYDGNLKIAKPGEVCTESYLVAFASNSEEGIISFKSYLLTKIFRFLLLQTVVSQNVTRERFMFIPHLEKYDTIYSDEILKDRWNITDEEWHFIDSKIKNIGTNEINDTDES